MSLIHLVDQKDATGEVAATYEQVKKQIGMIPNGLKAFGSSPYRLKAQVAELGYYMTHPTLGPQLTAAIRYVVASDHQCEYCVVMNGGMLVQAGWDRGVVRELPKNPGAAPLGVKDLAMLLTVIKAVRTPGEVNQGDISELRSLGWTDQDILDGVAHGAFSMAFDLILNTFKVTPDNLKSPST